MAWGTKGFGSTAWGFGDTSSAVTSSALTAALNGATVLAGANAYPTGETGTGFLGDETVTTGTGISVSITGFVLTSGIGEEFLWSEIDDSQTPGWSTIPATSSATWSDILT